MLSVCVGVLSVDCKCVVHGAHTIRDNVAEADVFGCSRWQLTTCVHLACSLEINSMGVLWACGHLFCVAKIKDIFCCAVMHDVVNSWKYCPLFVCERFFAADCCRHRGGWLLFNCWVCLCMKKMIRQYYNVFPDNYELIVVRMMTYNSYMVNFTNILIFKILKNFLRRVMDIRSRNYKIVLKSMSTGEERKSQSRRENDPDQTPGSTSSPQCSCAHPYRSRCN